MKKKKEIINYDLFGTNPIYQLPKPLKELDEPEIFEFRGTNGSGKTSVPRMMIEHDDKCYVLTISDVALTVCPTFKTILIGKYNKGSKSGGCDGLRNNKDIIKHIHYAIDEAKDIHANTGESYRILYEGIMTSTTNYGVIDFLPHDYQLNILFMDTPLETCLERIYMRNGSNKGIKEDKIRLKFNQVRNQIPKLKETRPSINLFSVPNSSRGKEQLLERWIELNYVKI